MWTITLIYPGRLQGRRFVLEEQSEWCNYREWPKTKKRKRERKGKNAKVDVRNVSTCGGLFAVSFCCGITKRAHDEASFERIAWRGKLTHSDVCYFIEWSPQGEERSLIDCTRYHEVTVWTFETHVTKRTKYSRCYSINDSQPCKACFLDFDFLLDYHGNMRKENISPLSLSQDKWRQWSVKWNRSSYVLSIKYETWICVSMDSGGRYPSRP